MHPFTSLTLWALAACTTLILPTQTILPVYSAATFFCLIALKATRRRAKYVVWLMFSLGAGLWLVHGGWLTEWLSGTPHSPERWAHAITLWLRILAIVSTSQLWMQYVPVQRFIRALFASRLTPQAREMLLQRLQHWALERGSLIILFERHHTPFLNHCQQAWQLQNGALQPLC